MANFNDQWIEIFSVGSHIDGDGHAQKVTREYLEAAAGNFDATIHEAPIVVGHPKNNLPAYGWVKALRTNGNRLEAQFSDVDPEFEQLVREGKFKKRSASFYVDPVTAPANRRTAGCARSHQCYLAKRCCSEPRSGQPAEAQNVCYRRFGGAILQTASEILLNGFEFVNVGIDIPYIGEVG